ncbi:hypothetical protein F2P81_025343 [Scophthalmus maximus]|uniref:Uncharacterized protein n=1 Tax=Scophthalmus maximus TaxID=52904 RepID=A0A6A4RTR0_SCOMX|nr:hypothetical protein F2P81_025343 [Scophthalmus maximus]
MSSTQRRSDRHGNDEDDDRLSDTAARFRIKTKRARARHTDTESSGSPPPPPVGSAEHVIRRLVVVRPQRQLQLATEQLLVQRREVRPNHVGVNGSEGR